MVKCHFVSFSQRWVIKHAFFSCVSTLYILPISYLIAVLIDRVGVVCHWAGIKGFRTTLGFRFRLAVLKFFPVDKRDKYIPYWVFVNDRVVCNRFCCEMVQAITRATQLPPVSSPTHLFKWAATPQNLPSLPTQDCPGSSTKPL